MLIEGIEVYGFKKAIVGMRNAYDSWAKSDSNPEVPFLGPNDLKLAKKLIKAGGDHRKFLRQIIVQWDITIPRCIWQEVDTYKVGAVRNSCSTMHKLGSRDLEITDFQDGDINIITLGELNAMGYAYRNKLPFTDSTNGRVYEGVSLLHHLKLRLPEGFLQKATYTFNYEVAYRMYFARKNHRMPEWSGPGGICEHLTQLPYFKEFIEVED